MMSLKHDMKMYPPRVKMTVVARNRDYNIILPVQITGCSREGQLDMDLIIGKLNTWPNYFTVMYVHNIITLDRPSISKSLFII